MKLDVTRDVVGDLWPLYRSGDASADTRTVIEAFLAQDEPFADLLKKSEGRSRVMPEVRLSPEAERRLLDQARERARMKLMVVGATIGLVGLMMLTALGGALYLAVKGF